MESNKCVAIILAGGKSDRMGQPKGLLNFFGEFWILEQLKRLKLGGISKVFVGLGYDAELYYKAIPNFKLATANFINIEGLKLGVVVNNKPELGSFSTLKVVLKHLKKEEEVLIFPVDTPILNAAELKLLMQQEANIIKPQFNGQSGHPIVLKKDVIDDLIKLSENSRLDVFINSQTAQSIKLWPSQDEQIILNLNTPQDWEAYKNRFKVY